MHTDKKGRPKILERCTLPLTAQNCVDRIYTDMAVIDVTPKGLELIELSEGVDLQDVINATDAEISVPDGPILTF
jgi:acyl CoA:acetate/3-ketoacid CoA transferase beta subunit